MRQGAGSSPSDDSILTGWKAIALYFGKGLRTVQRWEAELGLPVHRMNTGRGDTVYARGSELDAWRLSLDRARTTDADSGTHDAPPVNPDCLPPVVETSAGGRWGGDEGTWTPALGGLRSPWSSLRVVAAAAAVVSLVASVVLLARVWSDAERQPSSVRLDINALRVYDSEGVFLWSHGFERRLVPPPPPGAGETGPESLVTIADLDGDGNREIVAAPTTMGGANDLRCFDHRGKLRWSRRLGTTVRFGETDYAPPWLVLRLFVIPQGRRSSLWVSWVHYGSGEFPSVVERLGPNGEVEAEYWSAGYVTYVSERLVDGRARVLIGAVNNDHRGAGLAVFDARTSRGTLPVESAAKTCFGCPPGRPEHMVVFPALDTARGSLVLPTVWEVKDHGSGQWRVSVDQGVTVPGDATRTPAFVFYDLSYDLTPRGAEPTDSFVSLHRRLERLRLLDHEFSQLDARQAWPVLVYKRGTFVSQGAVTKP